MWFPWKKYEQTKFWYAYTFGQDVVFQISSSYSRATGVTTARWRESSSEPRQWQHGHWVNRLDVIIGFATLYIPTISVPFQGSIEFTKRTGAVQTSISHKSVGLSVQKALAGTTTSICPCLFRVATWLPWVAWQWPWWPSAVNGYWWRRWRFLLVKSSSVLMENDMTIW
jgi:hypothetical protein